jgi:hypothetical protein
MGQDLKGLALAPLGRSVTKTLIGAGILGLLATLWSEWSNWRRNRDVYVIGAPPTALRGSSRPGAADASQRAAAPDGFDTRR